MLDPDAYVILGLKASAWLVLAVTLVAAALRGPIMLLGIPSWLFYLAMARVMERQWRFAKDLEATLADLRTRQAA